MKVRIYIISEESSRNSNLMMRIVLILLSVIAVTFSDKLYFHSPQQLKNQFKDGIPVQLSSIGFNPRSGQLEGTLVMAQPFDACQTIKDIQNSQQDIFVLVNDQTCLQSTKARNIQKGGGIVGLMRQNQNTTLHDKDANIVQIPIVQISPQIFDKIVLLMSKNPNNKTILATLNFGSQVISQDIITELWMSPTEVQTYGFLINMENFLNNQKNQVVFEPRFAMHSQNQRKTFIGCFSNGMYCSGEIDYDGILQGQNIIEETLRQIVIRNMGMDLWWKYLKYFYVQCLHNNGNQDVFMSQKALSVCSKNSMMLAQIDYTKVQQQMNLSFVGPRKQVDDNILLREQRQDYIREKITTYPVMLINKKEFDTIDQDTIKLTICKMQSNRSAECNQLLGGQLQQSEVQIIVGFVLVIVILILTGYKLIMRRMMQKQMKSEVTSTLEQYYRYMETLQGQNEPSSKPRIYKPKPDSSNQIHDQLTKDKTGNRENIQQVEIQLGPRTFQQTNKRKKTQQGHQTLVQEDN